MRAPSTWPRFEAAYPRVRFVTQPERGAAAARNKGVEVTTAPWIFLVDADCVPSGGWLARARAIARGDPTVVSGGRIEVFDETPAPRSGAEAFETVFAFDQERYIREDGFSVTANLVAAPARSSRPPARWWRACPRTSTGAAAPSPRARPAALRSRAGRVASDAARLAGPAEEMAAHDRGGLSAWPAPRRAGGRHGCSRRS
jgi:hypothetical protein